LNKSEQISSILGNLYLNLVILTFFEGNLAFIWPFFIFQGLAFFETAYGQI